MSENSYLSNALYAADDKAEYDAGAKKILADKQVLAWILKYCVKEFKEYPIYVIQDTSFPKKGDSGSNNRYV